LLDSLAVWRVGFRSDGAGVRFSVVENRFAGGAAGNLRFEI
jgi:hypothetical protein